MCVKTIIDSSVAAEVWKEDTAPFAPFRAWVARGDGPVIYTTGGKFGKEMRRIGPTPRMAEWRRRSLLRRVPEDAVAAAERGISESALRSDDPQVLALAAAGGARVLCANDTALEVDFRNRAVLPDAPGGPRRTFPHGAKRAQRKKFLDRRKCPGPCS